VQAAASTINDLLNALNELRAEQDTLRTDYELRLAALGKRIEAVQTTLELFAEEEALAPHGAQVPLDLGTNGHAGEQHVRSPQPMSTTAWAQELQGLTQIEALVRIAERNGGVLNVADARRILIATGLTKGKTKNVASHLYHMLREAKQFEKGDVGAYRLVPAHADMDRGLT